VKNKARAILEQKDEEIDRLKCEAEV